MDEKLDRAFSKLGELIAVYNDHPATLNNDFQENMVALQKARRNPLIEERLHEIFSKRSTIYKQDLPLLMSAMQFEEMPDIKRKATEEIFENMNTFYKVRALSFL